MLDMFKQAVYDCAREQDFTAILDGDEFICRKLVTTSSFQDDLIVFKTTLPSNTKFYADGFQMLSQCHGTFENPIEIGRCPDDAMPYSFKTSDIKTASNYILFEYDRNWYLIGFTSCTKYVGKICISRTGDLKIIEDLENISFKCGDIIQSESFVILKDLSKDSILKKYGALINLHHPKLHSNISPLGWCSWYWYYASISENDITENLQQLLSFPALPFVQIDDGYQTHMGDWLSFSDKFPNGFENLIQSIHDAKKEPAIWVAPFIVSEHSSIYANHKDWLATDEHMNVIPSERLTYGGWRDTPWYVLDFSNPDVIDYITHVFYYFRYILNIKYFKLDACYWGCIKGYKFKGNISRIENYRIGLKTILNTIGEDAFIIGCNAPLWPSLELVHAMRVGDDIERNQSRIQQIAKEVLNRLWMKDNLWTIDPDCLCLNNLDKQIATDSDYRFHIATIILSDGVLLLGDKLSVLSDKQKKLIDKMIKLKNCKKTIIHDDDFTHFTITLEKPSKIIEIYLNWNDSSIDIPVHGKYTNFIDESSINTDVITLASKDALMMVKE